MKTRDDVQPIADERESQGDRSIRRTQQMRPVPPQAWSITPTGRGLRVWVLDWDQTVSPNSNTAYNVRYTELCDLSTTQGIDAAYARSKIVLTLQATAGNAVETEGFIVDEDKQSGFFFITGVDKDGSESAYPTPPRFIAGQGLTSSIPGVVTRFSASESGEAKDGTVYSVISLSMLAPNPLGSFFAVQPVLQNYPNRGDITAFSQREYGGAGGGKIEWELILPVGRRKGLGTVTATNGSPTVTFSAAENCLKRVFPGDYIEILGVQAEIKSVDSATQITLGIPAGASVNWAGQTVVAAAASTYDFIASVTIYMRSLSQDGNGAVDLSQLPSQTVLLDGELSAPNAPVLTTEEDGTTLVSTLGKVNRLFIAPVLGTEIKTYFLYRASGASVPFTDPNMKRIATRSSDNRNTIGLMQVDDQDFTLHDLEQLQAFTYYATAVNSRNQESAPSAAVVVSCRLDAPADNAPTVPAGSNPKNLLFNSFITGTVAGTVSLADAAQDAYMGGTANTDGRGAFPVTPDFRGYNRWDIFTTGAATPPGHDSITEVVLPAPGAADLTQIKQTIGAWQNGTLAAKRVDKGRDLMLAVFVRGSSPAPPNGQLALELYMLNAGLVVGQYNTKVRLPNDTFDVTGLGAVFTAGAFTFPNSQVLYGVFTPITIPATVTDIQARITHAFTNNGNNLLITKVMLCYGDQLAAWTPEMVLAQFPNATAPVPRSFDTDEGGRRGFVKMP